VNKTIYKGFYKKCQGSKEKKKIIGGKEVTFYEKTFASFNK